MQRFRKKQNRRLSAGLALVGLLCQIVLFFVHVPGVLASQSITEAGQLETIICTASGFKRVVIDITTGDPVDGSPDQDIEYSSVTCAVCTSLANAAFAVLPDVAPFSLMADKSLRVGVEPRTLVVKAVFFRASQRAPPFQA